MEKTSDLTSVRGNASIREIGISHATADTTISQDDQPHANGWLVGPVHNDLTVSAPGSDHAGIRDLTVQTEHRRQDDGSYHPLAEHFYVTRAIVSLPNLRARLRPSIAPGMTRSTAVTVYHEEPLPQNSRIKPKPKKA